MPHVVFFRDALGTEKIRETTRTAHLDHIRSYLPSIVASGGLLSDDGTKAYGGLIILRLESDSAVHRFVEDDPFTKAGVYSNPDVWACTILTGAERSREDDHLGMTMPIYACITRQRRSDFQIDNRSEAESSRGAGFVTASLAPGAEFEAGKLWLVEMADRRGAQQFASIVSNSLDDVLLLSRWRKAFLHGRAFL
jgi:uncharacterized protein YciI